MLNILLYLLSLVFILCFWYMANWYVHIRSKYRVATGGWFASLAVSVGFRVTSLAFGIRVLAGSSWAGACGDIVIAAEWTVFAALILLVFVFNRGTAEDVRSAYGRW